MNMFSQIQDHSPVAGGSVIQHWASIESKSAETEADLIRACCQCNTPTTISDAAQLAEWTSFALRLGELVIYHFFWR